MAAPDGGRSQLAPAPTYTALVFHGFAHVRMPAPASLHWDAYITHCRSELPSDAWKPMVEDAAVLERLAEHDRHAGAAQMLPELHRDVSELLAQAGRDLAALTASEVASVDALTRIRSADQRLVEILRADLALMAPTFARVHADVLRPSIEARVVEVADLLGELAQAVPSLAAERVELALALGPRGRCFQSRVVVGAPSSALDVSAETSAVLALHEHATRGAGPLRKAHPEAGAYLRAEWHALTLGAHAMTSAPANVTRAHGDWLASLDLRALCREAVHHGLLTAEQAHALDQDRPNRAQLLRQDHPAPPSPPATAP